MKRSDKFALFLCIALGTVILMLGIAMDLGGAFEDTPTFHSSGWGGIIMLWLSLCLVFVAPLWLLLKGIGAIIGR